MGDFALSLRGVVYLECPREGVVASHPVLREHEVVTGADRPVATIEGTLLCGLSVSPDGEAIIYGCSDWGTSDVLMIEDFR